MRIQNIIVELAGGLGNQLFQYAFSQVLLAELQYQNKNSSLVYKIWLDGTGIKRDIKRKLHLLSMLKENASISKSSVILSRRKLFALLGERIHLSLSVWEKVLHKAHPYVPLNKAMNYLFLSEEIYLLKTHGKNSTIVKTLTDTIYSSTLPVFVQGFWQNSRIVKNLLQNLHRDLLHIPKKTPAFTHACNFIQSCNRSVSLHVRRTDYLNATIEYPQCSIDYYKNALVYLHRMFLSKQGRSEMHVFIFSDDVVWCKKYLIPLLKQSNIHASYKLVCDISRSRLSDIEELILMSLCTYHVLANSSFSWWGSGMLHDVFLSHQKSANNGIVIAPLQWHTDTQNNQCIHMPDWVLL